MADEGLAIRGGSVFYAMMYRSDAAWYPDELADLAHVGGTPVDEVDLEDGLEAPLRPSLRGRAHWDAECDEAALPDIEELWQREVEAQRQLPPARRWRCEP